MDMMNIESAFEKLLRSVLFEKYPIFLEVGVVKSLNRRIDATDFQLKDCYEVYFYVLEDDWKKMENKIGREVVDYVKNLAKYMDITICGVYYESLSKEEWEEMMSDEDQSPK